MTDATASALDELARGELEVIDRLPWSSNATFLARLVGSGQSEVVVYKPQNGERPLWDFEAGTLSAREVAAFEVSEALEFCIVPPTILREGPFGFGMVQLFVDHDPDHHYLELRDAHPDRFREFAAFDVVVNNADRKAGHCIQDASGHIWGIDHGLTFHVHDKLRTVIWDFADEPLTSAVIDGLCRLDRAFDFGFDERLGHLVSPDEVKAVRDRLRRLLDASRLPVPGGDYPFPWPLV